MIDIILPTIGRASLAAAIQSVLDQSYKDWQLWVVCDRCDPTIEQKDSRICKILVDNSLRTQNDKSVFKFGPSRDSGTTARRLGISVGSGEWVAYIDDDDEWLPHHLESLINFATAGEYDAVHSYGHQFKFSRGRKKVSGVIVKASTTVSMLHTREIYNKTPGWINAPNHDHVLYKDFKTAGANCGVLPQVTYLFYRGKRNT